MPVTRIKKNRTDRLPRVHPRWRWKKKTEKKQKSERNIEGRANDCGVWLTSDHLCELLRENTATDESSQRFFFCPANSHYRSLSLPSLRLGFWPFFFCVCVCLFFLRPIKRLEETRECRQSRESQKKKKKQRRTEGTLFLILRRIFLSDFSSALVSGSRDGTR